MEAAMPYSNTTWRQNPEDLDLYVYSVGTRIRCNTLAGVACWDIPVCLNALCVCVC